MSFSIEYFGHSSHALKGKYSGTLLIASSQDGNRCIFSVTFAIVEGETKEVWEWFFYNLRTFVTPQPNICVISDRGTRLLAALRTQLQEWYIDESIYCICHLASNFNNEFQDSDLKDKVFQMDCEEFQSLRLSCSRAIATCSTLNLDCSQFISPIYRLDNILKVYGLEFQPIGNEEYWPPYFGPSFIHNPVMHRKRTGGPKNKRICNETDEVQSQQIKKCGWCKTEDHNRKKCP
ncbi:hypothetical protein Lal_00031563 [Lupinus albus]|nr:hypothetical protein Lal_00031563 [Lupinus albus]